MDHLRPSHSTQSCNSLSLTQYSHSSSCQLYYSPVVLCLCSLHFLSIYPCFTIGGTWIPIPSSQGLFLWPLFQVPVILWTSDFTLCPVIPDCLSWLFLLPYPQMTVIGLLLFLGLDAIHHILCDLYPCWMPSLLTDQDQNAISIEKQKRIATCLACVVFIVCWIPALPTCYYQSIQSCCHWYWSRVGETIIDSLWGRLAESFVLEGSLHQFGLVKLCLK